MFSIFGRKHVKAANLIGTELHRQMITARNHNPDLSEKRLHTPFVAGYFYSFIRFGFSVLGFDGEKLADEHMKRICDGIIPGGMLFASLHEQLSKLERAKTIGGNNQIEKFERGIQAGAYDAGVFSVFTHDHAQNLYNYLVGHELMFDPAEHE